MELQVENGEDNGALKYGNFINYYAFNPAENRINILPTNEKNSNIWQHHSAHEDSETVLALDVGCNAGNLTQLLHTFLSNQTNKQVILLGIDIDPLLIQRCRQHNSNPELFYESCDIMDPEYKSLFNQYLQKYGKLKFDAIFCFSITMWIHLNHGDVGLKEFLVRVSSLSRMLVIEPQPWKCYLSAVRRMKRANKNIFEQFEHLKIRNSIETDIQEFLEGICKLERLYQTNATKWNRKIAFYKNKT